MVSTHTDITKEHEIEDFPTLKVYKQNGDVFTESHTFDGDLKFNTIGDWLDGFALEEKAEPYIDDTREEETQ